MTAARYREIKRRVEELTTHWEGRLGIERFAKVRHVFVEDHHEDPDQVADTEILWQYRSAKITFYLPPLSTLQDDTLEESVVHEYVHILVAAMEQHVGNGCEEQVEYAVENVTQALLAATGYSRANA